jgi:phosphoribosylformylglycinamidine (FGAM) synthase PurS component
MDDMTDAERAAECCLNNLCKTVRPNPVIHTYKHTIPAEDCCNRS